MHRLIPLLVLALAACAPQPSVRAFRPPEAPIWSAAAFDPARIAGAWRQAAGFAADPGGCRAGGVELQPVAQGLAVRGTLCLDGQSRRIDSIARVSGPGRLAVEGGGWGGGEGGGDWWVLWVDTDYRTLVIGTPTGRFGFVLDRGALPPDRLAAAREIFDFNGYVTGALRPF